MISPGNKQVLALKTMFTETTPIDDSSHVASVEKWRLSFVQRFESDRRHS